MTDTLAQTPGQRIPTDYVENTVSVGGQLIKEQGKTLHYDVMGEIALAGEDAGQFQIEGKGDHEFPPVQGYGQTGSECIHQKPESDILLQTFPFQALLVG